jgi:hypothetical protein
MVPHVPPGFEMVNPNGAVGAIDIGHDVPPGFETVTPKAAGGAVDIRHDVPPGFEMATPKGAAGSSSLSAVHKVQSLAFSVHIVELL